MCFFGMGPAPVWEIRGSLGVIFSRGVQRDGGAGAAALAPLVFCLIDISPCHRGWGSPAVGEFRL